MSKIGNTDSRVFTCMHQYFWYAREGYKVEMSTPHPDAPGDLSGSAATFSVVPTDEGVEIEPVVKDAIKAMSSVCRAIGTGGIMSVEEIPIQENETKYIVTIKKREPKEFTGNKNE